MNEWKSETYRLAVEAWGLKNCTQREENFSDTVTAVVVPAYIDSAEIVKHAWKRYNLSLGLGLNKVAGKVFRIGHLGNLNEVSPQIFLTYLQLAAAMKSSVCVANQ
jgi:aspartate aminotransferase-like enzyme